MRRVFHAAAAVVFISLSIVLVAAVRAQQPPAQPPAQPAGPPPRPLVPVAANTLTANPDRMYGELVTITAAIDQILSKTAFTIEQRTVAGTRLKNSDDLLVLAPTLQLPVDLNSYVTVFGEVVRFDPAEIASKAKDYKLDLAPDVVAKYIGRPAVIATGVVNAKMLDVAKRQPPPLSAEEEAYSKMMKRVGPAFTALRNAAASSSADVAPSAGVLKQAFTETEAFWKAKGKADAIQWAHDARTQAESIERDAAAGKWEAVTAAAATLGQRCQACHGAYRERFDDGSFRIKIPASSR